MVDFVCVGDATRDLFLFVEKPPVFDGSKIPVENIAWSLGGNAANVSVGLTRLGLNTALLTVFGDDDRGVWIKRELLKNNVNLENALTENRQSNLSAVVVANGQRTIFSYHCPTNKTIGHLPQSAWFYLTSFSGHLASLPSGKIAFNPSISDLKKGQDYLAPILAKTEVLIMNKEEAEMLGTTGPKITVVTDGPNPVTIHTGDKVLTKAPLGDPAFEPTGAGDAFSSGFLAALFYGKDMETALDWGLKNSAAVIKKVGAIEGLLTRDVMLE